MSVRTGLLLVTVTALCCSFGMRAWAQAIPPAPLKPYTFRVVFGQDRADLDAREREVIAQAAKAITYMQIIRIKVSAPTSQGGNAAELSLSEWRARNVESELVRDGVAADCISIHRLLESNPLLPGRHGLGRNPQYCRRVLIDFM